MTDIDHEEMKDMVASYVLGALPLDETGIVRAHILSCDECMAEADSFDRTASKLALGVEEVPLPAGFTERVMAAASPASDERIDNTGALRPRRRWNLLATAAAVVGLLAFGAVIASWQTTDSELDRTQSALIAVLHGDGGTFSLRGPGGAVARVVPRFEGAYLIAVGLQEAPRNHVYQLWLMQDGEPVSAGLFDGSEAVSIVETGADLSRYEGAAITVEPEGGSAKPTTDPILATTT